MKRINKLNVDEWISHPEEEYELSKVILKKTIFLPDDMVYSHDRHSLIKRTDNEIFVIVQSDINFIELVIWSIGFFSGLYFTIYDWENQYYIFNYLLYIPLFLYIYPIINCLKGVHRKITFNRFTSLVAYSGTMWFNTNTQQFDDLNLRYHNEGICSALPVGLAVKRSKYNFIILLPHHPYTIYLLWSGIWIVTVPCPMKVFSIPTRAKEYQYRKSESFTSPLYPSVLGTPK